MKSRSRVTTLRAVLGSAIVCLAALSAGYGQNDSTGSHSYAGQQNLAIKRISAREIAGLRAGEGPGMAKAAELNSYPGPRHVLDLAEALSLSDEQSEGSEALFQEMKKDALRLGEEIIHREVELETLFESGKIAPAVLLQSLKTIADLRAELRYTHLVAHLKQRKLLTDEQVKRYNRLRGYAE